MAAGKESFHGLYKESFHGLYHGTTLASANGIIENGFRFSVGNDSWCGAGVYFFDVRALAWNWANRVAAVRKRDGEDLYEAVVVETSAVDVDRDLILDLRDVNSLYDLKKAAEGFLRGDSQIHYDGDDELSDEERLNRTRAILIDMFCKMKGFALVVGIFKQNDREERREILKYAESINIVSGVETIYCVKDTGILGRLNVRRRKKNGKDNA